MAFSIEIISVSIWSQVQSVQRTSTNRSSMSSYGANIPKFDDLIFENCRMTIRNHTDSIRISIGIAKIISVKQIKSGKSFCFISRLTRAP